MRQYSEQEQVRRDKLEEISKVCNPYPAKFDRTHLLKEAKVLVDHLHIPIQAGSNEILMNMNR